MHASEYTHGLVHLYFFLPFFPFPMLLELRIPHRPSPASALPDQKIPPPSWSARGHGRYGPGRAGRRAPV